MYNCLDTRYKQNFGQRNDTHKRLEETNGTMRMQQIWGMHGKGAVFAFAVVVVCWCLLERVWLVKSCKNLLLRLPPAVRETIQFLVCVGFHFRAWLTFRLPKETEATNQRPAALRQVMNYLQSHNPTCQSSGLTSKKSQKVGWESIDWHCIIGQKQQSLGESVKNHSGMYWLVCCNSVLLSRVNKEFCARTLDWLPDKTVLKLIMFFKICQQAAAVGMKRKAR
jgi:hypothetical protein